MNNKILLNTQKVLTHVILAVAIISAVYALGFMTNLYVLYFDGTMETGDFYQRVQTLNSQVFTSAVICVIYAILLRGFGLSKKLPDISAMILVVIGSIYTIIRAVSMIILIPQYAALYNGLDFSKMDEYVKSFTVFNLGLAIFYTWTILLAVYLILCAVNYVTSVKKMKLRSQSYE
jgi:hypothetical protein